MKEEECYVMETGRANEKETGLVWPGLEIFPGSSGHGKIKITRVVQLKSVAYIHNFIESEKETKSKIYFSPFLQNGLDDDEDEEEDTEDDSFGYEGEATEDDLNEVNSDLDLENSEPKSATPAELILQRCQIAATQIVCGLDEESHSPSQQIPSQAESLSADQPRDCLAPQKVSHPMVDG